MKPLVYIKPTDRLEAALAYARRGWAVFPLRGKGKVPMIPEEMGGRGCLDASSNEGVIRSWWGDRWPGAGIGIATGSPSGFFVIDVDPRHGGDETLAALEDRHGPLPETVVGMTGGGGRHLLFRHVPGLRNTAEKIGPGIDTRADGGYVVAPPSTHDNGRQYAWDVDHHPDEWTIAEAPAWLIAAWQAARVSVDGTRMAELPENRRKLVADGVGEGQRNVAVSRLAGLLLRKHIDPFVALDLVRVWNAARCRPPLPDDELVKTVDSIASRELARRRAPA